MQRCTTPVNVSTKTTNPPPTPTKAKQIAKAKICEAIAENKLDDAFKLLMTHPTGRQMDYAESRMMYG